MLVDKVVLENKLNYCTKGKTYQKGKGENKDGTALHSNVILNVFVN